MNSANWFEQVHLSWADDPSSTLTLTWFTPGGKEYEVLYRPAGADTWQSEPMVWVPVDETRTLSRASLRGLQPFTTYEYQLVIREGKELTDKRSPIWTTRTAPAGAADFTFGFLADTGLIGRLDGNATGTAQVLREIAADDPLFLLGAGDYAYGNKDGRYETMADAIAAWFNQVQPLLTRAPFMPQYGNHEIHLAERYEDWAPRFAHPEGPEEGRYYSFDVADIHFAALFIPHRDVEAQQLAWLDAALAKAKNDGTRWLIVYQHESIYGHGSSHPAYAEVRAKVAPILEKHRVDLHLSAHDQNYERTFPLVGVPDPVTVANRSMDEYQQGQGVVYAKVSPGGKMSEIGHKFSTFTVPQQDFMAVRDDTAHHYALVHVRAAGEIIVEVFSVIGDGSPKRLLDRFRLCAT
jgi:acid phosphatase type 7